MIYFRVCDEKLRRGCDGVFFNCACLRAFFLRCVGVAADFILRDLQCRHGCNTSKTNGRRAGRVGLGGQADARAGREMWWLQLVAAPAGSAELAGAL